MGLKKRLTTFVSNWLGVIIAALIVIISATFGGMYLYARSRLDNTINFVTQVINLRYPDGLTLSGTADNPAGHLVLQVVNPSADTVDVSISDVSITLGTDTMVVVKDGSWDKSVPTGYTTFEGDITIDAQTFAALVSQGKVTLDIKGVISASGQYKWVKRDNQRPFNISIPGVSLHLNS
jgi:hypothetical protein